MQGMLTLRVDFSPSNCWKEQAKGNYAQYTWNMQPSEFCKVEAKVAAYESYCHW